MKIPQKIRDLGMTDDEIISLVQEVATLIAPGYKFGYYEDEDIIQEAVIIGLTGLKKFSSNKGNLENFLKMHISSRMKDFKRDNYYRPDTKNSIDKIAVMNPIDISLINPDFEPSIIEEYNVESEINYKDMIDKINRDLPVDYRRDYLKLLDGVNSMSLKRKNEVIHKVREIVGIENV